MLISGFLFAGVALVVLIMLWVSSIFFIVSSILLICFTAKQKRFLKEKEIEEGSIKKAKIMSVFSILISMLSCIGIVISILPIVAIIMCGIASKMLCPGNFDKAKNKLKTALTLLMISNIITLVLVILNLYSCGDLVMFPLAEIIFLISTK